MDNQEEESPFDEEFHKLQDFISLLCQDQVKVENYDIKD